MGGFVVTEDYPLLLGYSSEGIKLKLSIPLAVIEFGDYRVKVDKLNLLKACLRKEIRNALQSDKFSLAKEWGEIKTFEDITYKIHPRHPEGKFVRSLLKFYELLEFAMKQGNEIIFYDVNDLSSFEKMLLREIKHAPQCTITDLINKFKKDERLNIVLNKLETRGFITIIDENIIPNDKLIRIPYY
jgi:hypothetical protein